MQVLVRDNNIDQALRVLKKKMQREGVFREMKQRNSYEKPSERKNREKSEAIRRARKLARKKAQREGLIPDPKKKLLEAKKALGQRPGGAGTGDRGGMGGAAAGHGGRSRASFGGNISRSFPPPSKSGAATSGGWWRPTSISIAL